MTTTAKKTGKTTIRAAKMEYSAAQRRLYNMHVYRLADGSYECFPAGMKVPAGSYRVEE